MYNPRTRDSIHSVMLDNIREDVDKREGSVAFDMTAPTAEQIELLEYELRAVYLDGYADTASLDNLIRRADEMGVIWKPETKARGKILVTGVDGTVIPEGFRVFTSSGIYFRTLDNSFISNEVAYINVEAEIGGYEGNIGLHEVVDYERIIAGIISVTNETVFTGGIDAETRESLLERYLLRVRKPITSGNPYHYELWATEIEGVASAKVFSLWDGPGTVKVIVIGEDGRAPSNEVIDNVFNHIENERPIGADVTVEPVKEIEVGVSVKLYLKGDLTSEDIRDSLMGDLQEYLLSEAHSGVIRYARIGEVVISNSGIEDYEDLKLNGDTKNIEFDEDSVLVLGEVEIL